jgi:hypothetical protein
MAKKSSKKKKKGGGLSQAQKKVLRVALYLVAGLAGLGAMGGGAVLTWRSVKASPAFRVNLHSFKLNGCPEWVNANSMSASLARELSALPSDASLFHRDLAYAVQRELRASPWLLDVREVSRVMPNRLRIRALYRKPAGMVLYDGTHYLVDAEGWYLPDDLFRRPSDWQGHYVPSIVDRHLEGPPPWRQPWNGPRFAVGARLTDLLRREGLLRRLNVDVIDVTGVGRAAVEPDILLLTPDGISIKWGASTLYDEVPGVTTPPSAISDAQKLAMLNSKLREHPALTGIEYLDLRFHGAIYFRQRE